MSTSKTYKLTYFDTRGRGELIRMTLHAANQPFIDERIEKSKWAELKPTTPTGVLPVLETPEGKKLVESLAIVRYLARKFAFHGPTAEEYYEVEKIMSIVTDLGTAFAKFNFSPAEQKEDAKKNLVETVAPKLFTTLVKCLNESTTGFFVGDKATVADLSVIAVYDTYEVVVPEVLTAFPELQSHREKVVASLPGLAKYLSTRQ